MSPSSVNSSASTCLSRSKRSWNYRCCWCWCSGFGVSCCWCNSFGVSCCSCCRCNRCCCYRSRCSRGNPSQWDSRPCIERNGYRFNTKILSSCSTNWPTGFWNSQCRVCSGRSYKRSDQGDHCCNNCKFSHLDPPRIISLSDHLNKFDTYLILSKFDFTP